MMENIFKIRYEERKPSFIAFLYIILWNILVVYKYSDKFFAISDNFRKAFIQFHISGFDPISYIVISHWDTSYNIYRHPLLAFFMFIPNQINQGMMMLTGINWATIIMALILTFCAFYSLLFLTRIFNEIVGVSKFDSWLLGALTFSFGYVIVGMSVPDHFCLSMFMLILTLYVSGRKLKTKTPMTKWQTIVLFVLTAGISLNNGIKVFLTNIFVNGKRFWHPSNLILAIILPSAIIWLGARMEWKHFERPRYMARVEKRTELTEKRHDKIAAAVKDTTRITDTAAINACIKKAIAMSDSARQKQQSKKAVYANQGKPINKTEFGQWTDISTPRCASLVENIFGEPIQLHDDHLLGDVLMSRPVIVNYRHIINYIIEAIVAILFLTGIWYGRRSRFMWLALSFFGFDIVIHFVLGFGLNEVYIMSPHWLFIISISMAYLMKRLASSQQAFPLRAIIIAITTWLLIWNGYLYTSYLL